MHLQIGGGLGGSDVGGGGVVVLDRVKNVAMHLVSIGLLKLRAPL